MDNPSITATVTLSFQEMVALQFAVQEGARLAAANVYSCEQYDQYVAKKMTDALDVVNKLRRTHPVMRS